jgi:uncharacterized protein (TIGR00369 family)
MATMLELAQKLRRGEAPPPPVGRLLGFALKAVEPGRAVFEMEVDERHHNLMGTLHGGFYCDLADAAMGIAYASTLGEGESLTTVELKINFLRAVRKGKLTAEAKVVKAGGTPRLRRVRRDRRRGQARGTGVEHLHEAPAGPPGHDRERGRVMANERRRLRPSRPACAGSPLVCSSVADSG